MQLIELDGETIKLILNSEERSMLHLRSCNGTSVPLGCGREAILTLLADLGLVCEGECLRLYPRADGGCEIYATLARKRAGESDTLCYLNSPTDALSLRIALRRGGFDGESQIYLPNGEMGGCFLRIRGDHAPIEGEFGTLLPMRGGDALPWLGEHCTRLAEP